jgi:hypothetical protein
MNLKDSIASANELPAALKVGSLALGFLLSYIAPVQSFLIAVAVLVCADVVTGVWASHKSGEAITSRRASRTVSKLVGYPLAILLSHLMATTFFANVPVLDGVTYAVALFIAAVEFKSNLENISAITGIDLWAQVSDFINSKLKTKAQ